jgi:hypothetical protein
MCDVNGCTTKEIAFECPAVRTVRVALCKNHNQPSSWTRCPCCLIVVRVGVASVGTVHQYGPDQYLCGYCHGRVTATCVGCGRAVLANGTLLVKGSQQMTQPVARTICGLCITAGYKECPGCSEIVSVGGKARIPAKDIDGSEYAICRNCETNGGVGRCMACQRLVKVGQRPLEDCQPYRHQTRYLCKGKGRCGSKLTGTCGLCGTPTQVDNQKLTGAVLVAGTRWRCEFCAPGNIAALPSAATLIQQVHTFMGEWLTFCGLTYAPFGTRLTVRLAATLTGTHGGQTYGRCESTGTGTTSQHTIEVLRDLPPIRFQQTLVHELTHAVTHELDYSGRTRIEGFCNYAAYLFLHGRLNTATGLDKVNAKYLLGELERSENQVYGQAFRDIRDALQSHPRGAFTFLKEDS